MIVLHIEFNASKLKGAESKLIASLDRNVLLFKRLKNISEEAWESIGEANRLKHRTLLDEFEFKSHNWRRGPYGTLWNGGNLRMRPTDKEIDEGHQRQVQTVPNLRSQICKYILTFKSNIYKY